MDTEDVDLAPQIDSIVEALTPLATAKELDIAIKLPGRLAARAVRRRPASGKS